MNQYARVGTFSIAAGITAATIEAIFAPTDFASLVVTVFFVALFCVLTSWLGFGLAAIRHRQPSALLCAATGAAFICISAGLVTLLPGGFLHAMGFVIILIWFLITAPIFAFAGSVLSKPAQTMANPTLNSDTRQETPRAG